MAFPEQVAKLHTTLTDAKNGYAEAAKDAAEPAIAEFFRELVSLHQRYADQMGAMAQEIGVTIDGSESFMTTVHRTVVWIRSAIMRLDASELNPFISGEEQIVAEYDDALAESGPHPRLYALLMDQKTGLLNKIAEMKAMKSEA